MPIDKIKKNQKIRIGTRSSRLALAQAQEVKNLILSANPEILEREIEIIKINTSGDKIKDVSLADIGGKGLFIKELEEFLVEGEIDVAIHSAKDVPPVIHFESEIAAFAKRRNVCDYFVSNEYESIKKLPKNAVVGTSSARRKAILLKLRPDLEIVNFRGNVDTRLKKIAKNQIDATILAVCGLERIGYKIDEKRIIPKEMMVPAVGQGCVLAQVRKNDKRIYDIFRKINHFESEICVVAERLFLRILRASCRSPISVYCSFEDNKIKFQSMIYDFDGKEYFEVNFEENVAVLLKDVDKNHEKLTEIANKLAIQATDAIKDNAIELLERICR